MTSLYIDNSSSAGLDDIFHTNITEYNINYNTTNGTDDEIIYDDPIYFSYSYRIIGTLFQGIIFIVGVLGNLMVVLVVAKTKSMHSPTNCYLVSLAFADCIVLLASVPQEIISYYIVGMRWIWGEVGCALLIFSQNLGINASSLSLTAFTVERYIAICHPFLAQSMCTVSRAKKIIAGVWIFAFIYCSPWFFLTETFPLYYKGYADIQSCEFKLSREAYLWYYFADLIVFYIIPLLISVVLYSFIARILYKSSNDGKVANGTSGANSSSTKTNAARVQVVKMLICVVILFALLWLPYRGMLVYNSFATWFYKPRFMDLWFLMVAKTCVYINSSINPILYNAMSVKFRTSFKRMLICGKKNQAYYDRYNYVCGGTTYSAVPSTSTPTACNTMVTMYTNSNHLTPQSARQSPYKSVVVVTNNSNENIRSCTQL